MEQWTEQTSLRLLELIASTIVAVPAGCEALADSQRRADSNRLDESDRLDEDETPSNSAVCAAEDAAGLRLAGSTAATAGRVLAALAADDPHFGQWLRVRLQSTVTSSPASSEHSPPTSETSVHAPSARREGAVPLAERDGNPNSDWHLIAEHWLAWLAAEPTVDRSPAGDEAAGNEAASNEATGEEHARQRAPDGLYRRVLVANAQFALRCRRLVCERQKMRREIARDLAYDMAYGLSHELNNPLANIATRARLLSEEEPNERKKQLLAAIVDQAMRGCEMIADLMLVARPPVIELQGLELGSVVRDIVAKARPWAEARGLSLISRVPDEAVVVRSDRSAIAEALGALLRNAIEVARSEIVVTLSVAKPQSTRGQAGIATVAVQDDGPGISSHALAHALNPYFSGREAGRGLGLGLAKADRIAGLSGGAVWLTNAAAGGCIASIAWPTSLE